MVILIGLYLIDKVAEMLSSDMCDKREAGLRQVAEQTVQIVLSAGSAYSVEDSKVNSISDTINTDIVSSMGGHTTGLMLKEAFRVIARLLDDTVYTLFVGALVSSSLWVEHLTGVILESISWGVGLSDMQNWEWGREDEPDDITGSLSIAEDLWRFLTEEESTNVFVGTIWTG